VLSGQHFRRTLLGARIACQDRDLDLDASTYLGIAALLIVLALAASNVYAGRAVQRPHINPAPPQREPSRTHELVKRLDDHDGELAKLRLAVSDGIERVARAENRIQKTVTSARRAVREAGLEHAGIDAEFEELRPPDAEGIEPLPAMPTQVDASRTVRIPGGILEIGAA